MQKQKAVFGKKTKDIGKFDPNDKSVRMADLSVKYTNPVTGALEAYGPLMGQVSTMGVEHAVNLFHASKGKYPTYKEFMAEIVNAADGGLELPVLPALRGYRYDEANHKLVVVEPNEPPPAAK